MQNRKENNDLPWSIVEKAINKEIVWLKNVISTRAAGGILSFIENNKAKCDNCDYTYRKIALLIISGKIKAREINTVSNKDLWDGLTKKITKTTTQRHGGEWHKLMMEVTNRFFTDQEYDVTIEPHLNFGRADLGVYKKGKKDLFVEVGTVSIYKLLVNLQTMNNVIFLIVPIENKVIEFETYINKYATAI